MSDGITDMYRDQEDWNEFSEEIKALKSRVAICHNCDTIIIHKKGWGWYHLNSLQRNCVEPTYAEPKKDK